MGAPHPRTSGEPSPHPANMLPLGGIKMPLWNAHSIIPLYERLFRKEYPECPPTL